jgi:hypothetical protein
MSRTRLQTKESNLKAKYGLSLASFYQLKQKQNYKCAICTRKRKLEVDHDHKTGRVRGLLCNPCNVLLGSVNDNPFLFILAISYLQPWKIAERLDGIKFIKPNKNAIPKEGPRDWSKPRK